MVTFHHLAIQELRVARNWYRSRSALASERFALQLDQALNRILRDPESPTELGRGYRYVKIKRYPFTVVYRIQPAGETLVVAIAHTRRRPGYWSRRK